MSTDGLTQSNPNIKFNHLTFSGIKNKYINQFFRTLVLLIEQNFYLSITIVKLNLNSLNSVNQARQTHYQQLIFFVVRRYQN